MRRYAVFAVLIGASAIVWLAVRSPAPPPALPRATATPIDPAPPAPHVPSPSPAAKTAASSSSAWIPAPSPSMAKQAEANRRSVDEARETGRFPERLSAHLRPAPFDPAAFAKNPQAYLDVIEPGRVYQTAEPKPGVKRLAASGQAFVDVPEATPATLAAEGAPGAPVTFVAFGTLGAFDNTLTTITVKADDKGIARVIFTPAPGGTGSVRILAGSPLASGQASFRVGVKPEE